MSDSPINIEDVNENFKKLSTQDQQEVTELINQKLSESYLDLVSIGSITEKFNVPDFQRGYRWTSLEVSRLINDIWENKASTYCLQPIVVTKKGDVFDIIDGQQRLTTLFIILKYLSKDNDIYKPRYSIKYSTRNNSESFLKTIGDNEQSEEADKYIDFYFMQQAYDTTNKEFDSLKKKNRNAEVLFYEALINNVKVIWYQVSSTEDPYKLFERLNMWKIPLTNSELIKALFLNDSALNSNIELKQRIAYEWDSIERTLSNEKLWYFITSENIDNYQTKIDLLLKMIARYNNKKNQESKKHNHNIVDPYSTFFYFQSILLEDSDISIDIKLKDQWDNIYNTFQLIIGWFEDNELYHKIGFLLSSKYKNLLDIYTLWNIKSEKSKSSFIKTINLEISSCLKECLEIDKKQIQEDEKEPIDLSKRQLLEIYLQSLNYNETSNEIRKILLLMNVDVIETQDNSSYKFPFYLYNKTKWSLEHILAQNTEELHDLDSQKRWLKDYSNYLELKTQDAELYNCINSFYELNSNIDPKSTADNFGKLQKQILNNYHNILHSISNLALLAGNHNSSLGKLTFVNKRKKILEFESKGEFIPIWTKRIFQKSFITINDDEDNVNYDYWDINDRNMYMSCILDVLEKYYIEEK